MIEAAIRYLLLSDAQIRDVVGDRVHFMVREQNDRQPCVLIKRVTSFFSPTLGNTYGWPQGRIQLDCLNVNYVELKRTVLRIRQLVGGFFDRIKSTDPRYAAV